MGLLERVIRMNKRLNTWASSESYVRHEWRMYRYLSVFLLSMLCMSVGGLVDVLSYEVAVVMGIGAVLLLLCILCGIIEFVVVLFMVFRQKMHS